jgi:hypothetical protein
VGGSARFEQLQPFIDLLAERTHIDLPKGCRKSFQARLRPREQRASPAGIPALQVMKGSRHLNQSLQKGFFRFFRIQPNNFPMFMSRKELPCAIAAQAFAKLSFGPIQFRWLTLPCGARVSRISLVLGD